MFLSMRSGIFKCWVAKEVKGPWGKKQVIVKRAHKAGEIFESH
jgi:hypothetical protein